MDETTKVSIEWWIPALASGGFVLLGVLIGGAFNAALELWRQVLAFRAAARVVRHEIKENLTKCELAVTKRWSEAELLDEAWKAHRLQLAPLLPEQEYDEIARDYGGLFIVQHWLRQIAERFDESAPQIKQWMNRMGNRLRLLQQVERRSRAAQFLDALLSRPTSPPPVRDDTQKGAPAPGAAAPGAGRVGPSVGAGPGSGAEDGEDGAM